MTQNGIAKQVLNPAFAVHTKLGLLINFGEAHLKNGIKRVTTGHLDFESYSELSL
jgi:hypothetical protein